MDVLLMEIDRRWRQLFAQLARGDDAPPGQRLRLEGMMEAAVLSGRTSREQLQTAMVKVYRDIAGHGIADEFGEHWCELFPFPQIPAMARRAPVYPSTSE